MLISLSINDFATIESLYVDFKNGLNVLTGETGAGKSIIIDALSLLLGKRANYDFIRTNKDKASISGQFFVKSNYVKDYLSRLDIDASEALIIERTLYKEGRSTLRINGVITTTATIKEIASYLVDVHSQHDSTAFLRKKTHEDVLDNYIGDTQSLLLEQYKENYRLYKKFKKELANFEEENNDSLLEIYKYQVNEIENADLSIEEEEQLNKEKEMVLNSKKITDSINTCVVNLGGNNNILDLLYETKEELSKLCTYDEAYKSYFDEVSNAYFSLEDISNSFSTNSFDFTEDINIDQIEARLFEIQRIKMKYGGSIERVFESLNDLNSKIDIIENKEIRLAELNDSIASYEEICKGIALKLSTNRQSIAKVLIDEVSSYFDLLYLQNVEMKFNIDLDSQLNSTGYDIVEIYIKTNLGDGFKPLSKVVSGGELSRIMLSLKTALIGKYDTSTIIFDEIDTGVSGRVSNSFGDLMKKISKSTQVMTITHLPTVAAKADNHYKVVKFDDGENTFTELVNLKDEERVTEIAQMASGEVLTKESIEHARQLLS